MTLAARSRLLVGIILATIAPTGIVACTTGAGPLRIGTKAFSEQRLLGEIVGRYLERGLGTTYETSGFDTTFDVDEALKSGRIDMYVEYTGTALAAILRQKVPTDRARALELVQREYKKLGLDWLVPLGFENTFVLVIRGADARRLNVKTLTEAALAQSGWRLGIGTEFKQRDDGLAKLAEKYQLRIAPVPTVLDLTRLYRELEAGTVDMISANSTDGLLSVLYVQALQDDQHFFPPYEAGLVVRAATLDRMPGLREALLKLDGKLSSQQMQRLNYLVDAEHRPVKDVALTFLRDAGIVGSAQ
jgi:osmoprotectant transport system substrate-binding protein